MSAGKEQFVLSRHVDDRAVCTQAAQALVAEYAQRGQRARYLCHEVVEEEGEVDAHGNPLPATVQPANAGTLSP
ncbi:MAG TPA: hypothetical protein PKH69_01510 [Thiobacillaceae bacterium]|nr:hypothetical protein [Thiobacillaceae bacterium]